MDDILKDERFSHIVSDPRYKRIPKLERKVKIDKRFQSMFKDKRFTVKYTVDKRGRPVSNTAIEDLRRYYDISSDSESDDDTQGEDENKIISEKKGTASLQEDKDSSRVFCKKKTVKINKLPNKVVSGSESDEKPSKKVESYRKVKLVKPVGNCEINSEGEASVSNSDSDYSEVSDRSDGNVSKSLQLEAEEKLQVGDKAKAKLRDLEVDYARGEGQLTSSSSDDDSDEEDPDDELDHGWGELDQAAERTDEVTHRLALCNMDWDRIRASDLMVLFNSFLPQNGLIKSITIYPSEFGLQRMKEEELHGPPELRRNVDSGVFDHEDESREEDENEEGNDYHMEKLRQYQLNRLKYFYAVIDCDSEATANKLYTECDGLEYESSASRLDLRFIPNNMTFDHEPREVCDSLPEMSKYQPRFFTTTALQQSKVQLTWDETNPERTEIAQRVMSGDIDRADLRTYLATSSSEDENDDAEGEQGRGHVKDHLQVSNDLEDDKLDNDPDKTDPICKYKALLQDIEKEEEHKKNRGVEMEVSWGIGLKDKAAELARKKMKELDELTPFQQYLEKRKEKRKQKKLKKKSKLAEDGEENPYSDDDIPSDIDMSDPYFKEEFENLPKKTKKQKDKKEEEVNEETLNHKAELELLLLNESNSNKHFNFKAIQEQEMDSKKKKKKKKFNKAAAADVPDNDDFEVNVKDDRFEALFTSHHFNIDPADPHYHATKGMELLRTEKLKRRQQEDDQTFEPPGKAAKNSAITKQDADVTSLVKKVMLQTKFLKKII